MLSRRAETRKHPVCSAATGILDDGRSVHDYWGEEEEEKEPLVAGAAAFFRVSAGN